MFNTVGADDCGDSVGTWFNLVQARACFTVWLNRSISRILRRKNQAGLIKEEGEFLDQHFLSFFQTHYITHRWVFLHVATVDTPAKKRNQIRKFFEYEIENQILGVFLCC